MYLSFYKLNKKPFQISTDPKFLWMGKKHQEALAILQYGIEDDKGFLLLTGDVGTGKTTLLNAFVNSLENDVIVARISDPGLNKLDFITYVAEKFGMGTDFETKSEFLILFTAFLEQADRDQKKVLLIIDEAQHLTDEILEEIRLLSNIENQEKKLLNIFLVGQDEFNATIEKHKNRALRQRITISYTLYPLESEETKTCIEYRLGVAGVQKELFTPEAIAAIHTLSEGFPRVINIICDQALFRGCQEKQDSISDKVIWEIAKTLKFAHTPQTLEEADLSDPTDEEWLEASEVPPLSTEEILRASQPLPDPTPQIAEESRRKTHKYRVAFPIFIIAFLLSGFFVLDERKIDIITQFFTDRYKETIASPLVQKATEQLSQDTPTESDASKSPEVPTEVDSSTEAPSDMVYLDKQKKSLPKNLKPDVSQSHPEKIKPEIKEDNPPISDTASESSKEKQQTNEPQGKASNFGTNLQQAQSNVTESIIHDENKVLPTIPERAKTPTAESNSQTLETVDVETIPQKSGPTTAETIVSRDGSVPAKEEIPTPPATKIEGTLSSDNITAEKEVDETQSQDEEIISVERKEPPASIADSTPLAPKKDTLSEQKITETEKPEAPPVQSKPSAPEDPGAVIDWLLESGSN